VNHTGLRKGSTDLSFSCLEKKQFHCLSFLILPHRIFSWFDTHAVAFAAALVFLIVAIWGAITFNARSQQLVAAPVASFAIDVMRIMREAKKLPEERIDAH